MTEFDPHAPVDLAEFQEGDKFTPGIWPQIIRKAKIAYSKNDEPMIQIHCKVTEGPDKDKTLVDSLSLTPQSMWRVRQFLSAVQLVTGSMSWAEIADSLVNREFKGSIEMQEYEGTLRARNAGYYSMLS